MATERTRSDTTARASAEKTSAKKPPPKKAAPKKAAPRKAAAKKSSEESGNGARAPRAAARPRRGAVEIARLAAEQLLELTGKGAEGVTGLSRTDDGWTVQVEVVEVRRIPDTTDVLALYEVETDENGELQTYRRVRRYARGVPGED